MNALVETLENTTFEELTNEEITKLEDLGVFQYLGPQGVNFVNDTIKTSDFDPVSAEQDIKKAFNALNNRQKQFHEIERSLKQLNFEERFDEEAEYQSLIRVRFKEGASISDVVSWKKWANDWHDIVRGVAMGAKESPNDVRVIGASNGSIIVTLAGTATVTLILLAIVKNIGKIVQEILKSSNAIEDFRQKKLLTQTIEQKLKKEQKNKRESGVESTMNAIKEQFPDFIQGDVEAALKKSVEKYLNFSDKGGDVDFIPPRDA